MDILLDHSDVVPATQSSDAAIVIAIHPRRGSFSFSDRWESWCRDRGIAVRLVDGYASEIMEQLRGCDAFLWHFDHENGTDLLMARHVLTAAEQAGLVVFPDWHTAWHFDDKLAQKYVLEAIGAPLAPTWVFYDERRGHAWLREATLPLVRKLRRGAGSANVGLIRTRADGERHLRKMFRRGVRPVSGYFADISVRMTSARSREQILEKLRRAPAAIRERWHKQTDAPRERGYVLFQEFQPGNRTDTRVTVIGNRAWAFTRRVRKNDFRASGSRDIDFDQSRVDPECVRIAFDVHEALQSQSTAFDFVAAPDGRPRIVEISFGYNPEVVAHVPGQWDRSLTWRPGHARAEDAILDVVLESVRVRKGRTV